jgi:hypothetical protein
MTVAIILAIVRPQHLQVLDIMFFYLRVPPEQLTVKYYRQSADMQSIY